MTVKELKKILSDVPDNFTVRFEYDGPETHCHVDAEEVEIAEEDNGYIVFLGASE